MKSNISEFCSEFGEALFPLSEALGDTVKATENLSGPAAASMTEGLSNAGHRLEALINKVQGQEAYVLLFGPLKSGKSTLINAISGGYVSEVSSLPAYPCMVYLKYGETPAYSVIRYSGKQETIESAEALKDLLEKSHRTLSERIRAMDDFGETFDPASHLPSAIRRAYVELPVEGLKESGTVLVDTPGLYSKMKFGYDYMTREFRDSAACAVFIVKTDNLFLEQVFSDFNDLLDQFSRVFVVVNIDIGKSDLCPDGSLEPSLESRDPDQIVKAFEVLTMSAPLRRAAESGRLHLYPIDLRSAAARRLKEQAGTAVSAAAAPDAAAPDATAPDRFDEFLSDLFSYLNSVDYLIEFISDSIRQSGKISDEINSLCTSETVDGIEAHREQLEAELTSRRQQINAAATAGDIDWNAQVQAPLAQLATERAALRESGLTDIDSHTRALAGAWLDSDQSLRQLDTDVQGAVATALAGYREQAETGLRAVTARPFGGAELDDAARDAATTLKLDFAGLSEQVIARLEDPSPVDSAQPDLSDIPIHRTFGDMLLFRSADAIRNKIIGDPAQELPARVKETRFTTDAAQYIREAAAAALASGIDNSEQNYQDAARLYADEVSSGLGRQLTAMTGELKKGVAALETEQSTLGAVTAQIRKLAGIASATGEETGKLEEKHQHTVKQLKLGAEGAADTKADEPDARATDTGDDAGDTTASAPSGAGA